MLESGQKAELGISYY